MSTDKKHIRHGIGSVRPYIYGYLDLPDFVAQVFGAVEVERAEGGSDGFHVESRIGDSMIVMETGKDWGDQETTRASIYVYVDDIDAAYNKAIELGATSIAKPEDKPYQERSAGVKDTFGNTWWISTYTGLST